MCKSTNLINNKENENKYKKFIQNVFKDDYSVMKDIFYGVFELNIISKKNKKILSTSYDIFNSLSLGLDKQKYTSVNDLLNIYFEPELMDGDNMYFNDKTKEKEEVFKDLKIKKLPKILCIHLKRFTNNLKKIRKGIEFDTELNLNKYTINNNLNYHYELFGLVMHSGGFGGGHYYVNIKNMNKNWYNYNDTNVKQIDITKINKSHIYCLFYRLIKS